jgi:hypothetical protein
MIGLEAWFRAAVLTRALQRLAPILTQPSCHRQCLWLIRRKASTTLADLIRECLLTAARQWQLLKCRYERAPKAQ